MRPRIGRSAFDDGGGRVVAGRDFLFVYAWQRTLEIEPFAELGN
jgi:hypothetical protein